MAAAVRGGASRAAKPQSRAHHGKPPAKARDAHTGAKIRAGRATGLHPRFALATTGVVMTAGLAIFLFTGDRLGKIEHGIALGAGRQLAGVGFKVDNVHLQGASPNARADILDAAGVRRNEPILSVDLDDLRKRVEAVGWVQEARVVRLLPDTLVIHVKERPPVAVWQHRGVVKVIDAQGKVITAADPARFPELPFLVGEGAGEAAGLDPNGGVLALIAARPRLVERLEALVRVDNRRWDLRLKDGSIVQLPAVGEDSALIQLDQLDQSQRLLELGFERIDLRTPEMVVVRRREKVAVGELLAGGV